MPTVPDAFIEWVTRECEDRHWSWNYASEKAGLARGSISAWANQEKLPGIKSCKAMAKLFHKPPEYILQLAGHLPEPANSAPDVVEVNYRLRHLSQTVRERYMPIIRSALESAEAEMRRETEK